MAVPGQFVSGHCHHRHHRIIIDGRGFGLFARLARRPDGPGGGAEERVMKNWVNRFLDWWIIEIQTRGGLSSFIQQSINPTIRTLC
jgi:hypothetical protein